jgi:putative CocE/NonD family hydrolase
MPDGTRLASTHVWPIDFDERAPTLLLRTPYGVTTRPPGMVWLGRILAEYGYHVVLQDVRGRYASEGEFEPFVNEAEDGAATLDWLSTQRWSEGPVGMIGASYLAHCAWAAASKRPERVGALAIAIGSSDLHPLFYPHGVFSFANAVEWAAGVGEHEGVDRRQVDLDRAFVFEPVREADRVARCEVDFYRTWVDHPTRDEYWEGIRAPLPEPAPPTIFVAGWWDFFLEPELADHAALAARARAGAGPAPSLVIGPWSHGPIGHIRFWRDGMQRRAIGRMIGHFETHLAGRPGAPAAAPVRFFVCDPRGRGEWRDAGSWPPEDAKTLALHLQAEAQRLRLAESAPVTPGRIEFTYDPRDPTPSVGGALFGWKAGSKDQRPVAARGDVVVLQSDELAEDLVIAGPVLAHLFVGAELHPADFAVHLIDAAPGGSLLEVGDGLARLDAGESAGRTKRGDETAPGVEDVEPMARELVVSLAHRGWRFRAGHRVRVHIAPAHCPRFARARPPAANDDASGGAGLQWIVTSEERPSRIELCLPADGRFVTRRAGDSARPAPATDRPQEPGRSSRTRPACS